MLVYLSSEGYVALSSKPVVYYPGQSALSDQYFIYFLIRLISSSLLNTLHIDPYLLNLPSIITSIKIAIRIIAPIIWKINRLSRGAKNRKAQNKHNNTSPTIECRRNQIIILDE